MKKQKVESLWEKKQREKNMKLHQKRIKVARKKGAIEIEDGPDVSHVHRNLKKKQMEKERNERNKFHDTHHQRRMDEYVSTIDNDGTYLLEWLKLLQQLRRQKDFNTNSKYKNIQSLYLQIVQSLPNFDLDNLPDKTELMSIIRKENPELLKKLLVASTPKKKRRKRYKKGDGKKSNGQGSKGRNRKKKRRKGGMVNRLDVPDGQTDEDTSSSDDEDFRRRRSKSFSTTKRERNEQVERHRFLKTFLPTELQTGITDEDSNEKKEENDNNSKKKSSKTTDDIIIDTESPKKPKKSELETELEVKMAKEIWGFVFSHVKEKQIQSGGKSSTVNSKTRDREEDISRGKGQGDPKWGDEGDDLNESGRKRRDGFTGPNMSRKNMDDINEYSGEEDDDNNNQNKNRKKSARKRNDITMGDIDEYSGDEEDGTGHLSVDTTRKKKNKNKPNWKSNPSKLHDEDDDDYGITHDGLISAVTPNPPDASSFDWASSPVTRGYRPPQFSDYYRNRGSDGEDDDRIKRPSSSYEEVAIDRELIIENIGEYEFIGISMIWLKALSHFSHMFLFTPIISVLDHENAALRKGGIWGQLKAGVVPIDPDNGDWLTNHHVHAVEDPALLIGRPFHFKLMIESLKGDVVKRITDPKTENDPDMDVFDEKTKVRKRKVETALFVKYQMEYIKDQRITDVCERISRVDEETGVKDEGVLLHFEKEYSFPYMTKEVLYFLRNNAIRFEIYIKKKYLQEGTKKSLFSL